ncbi:MAG: hypothetical protein KDA96_14015, partial [Planctomycetaceae bacterium]|nr:hypothetical protein [Planctomycetaceae bacterium]
MILLKLTAVALMTFQIIEIDDVERSEPVSFETEVLPILQRNCLACHSASERQGDLVLESPQGMLKGGDSGPAIVPGKGDESLLIEVAAHIVEPVMPPEDNDVAAADLTPAELGLIRLWINQGAKGSGGVNSISPRRWAPLPKGVHPINALDVTDDGQYLVCGRANQIFLYHVPSGQLLTRLSDPSLQDAAAGLSGIAHRDLVQSVAFNLDGDLIASGGFREVKLWRRPRDVQQFQVAVATAQVVAVSPDQKWIAVGGDDHSVRLLDARTGTAGIVLAGHEQPVTAVRFSTDGQQLLTASLDQTIRIWKTADGTRIGEIESPGSIAAIEFVNLRQPTEQQPVPPQVIVTGGGDNILRTWSLPGTAPVAIPCGINELRRSAISRDGRALVAVGQNHSVGVRQVSVREPAEPGPSGTANTVSINRVAIEQTGNWQSELAVTAIAAGQREESSLVLIGSTAATVQLRKAADGAVLSQWVVSEEQPADVTSTAFSADGQMAAIGTA